MKKIIWTVLRIITITVALPFIIMKFLGDTADKVLFKILNWEDDIFFDW